MKTKSSHILRWVLLLPVAMLSALLITFPLHWVLYWTLSGGTNPFITPYPQTPEKLLQPMVSALTFVYVCGLVAPSSKLHVVKAAAIIWCSGVILAMFIVHRQGAEVHQIINANYYGIPILSGILGAVFGVIMFKNHYKKQMRYDNHCS